MMTGIQDFLPILATGFTLIWIFSSSTKLEIGQYILLTAQSNRTAELFLIVFFSFQKQNEAKQYFLADGKIKRKEKVTRTR